MASLDTAAAADAAVLSAVDLRRLRWRARRGMLENDLVLGRFFERHGDALTPRRAAALALVLELPDTELFDLLMARSEPDGAVDTPLVRELLSQLRSV